MKQSTDIKFIKASERLKTLFINDWCYVNVILENWKYKVKDEATRSELNRIDSFIYHRNEMYI